MPGCPHHIVARGDRRRDVFRDDRDRKDFVQRLAGTATSNGLHILAYALMRNHVHLIAIPDDRDSIAGAATRCLSEYAEAFRTRHAVTEPLWRERCNVSVLALPYFWEGIRYVERNPVRAHIVTRAEDYPWSSAAYHCGLQDDDLLIAASSPLKDALADWSAWLAEPDLDGYLASLRRKRVGRETGARDRLGVFDQKLDRRIFRGRR